MTKLAILQVADAGPLESLVHMLTEAGYTCVLPNDQLRRILRDELGMDCVLDPHDLTRGMGYDPVHVNSVGPAAMDVCDLYVDIKAQRCHDKVVARWPRLRGKVVWYRINGSAPEHVVRYAKDGSGRVVEDCGNEADVPCPVLTPVLWYACDPATDCDERGLPFSRFLAPDSPLRKGGTNWADAAYPCWPPFVKAGDYYDTHRRPSRDSERYGPPVCLLHNARGWGYGKLFDPLRALGLKVYGAGSPDGLVRHRDIPKLLSTAVAMVHLKSSDAPGYALYEALAAGCPVVCPGRLIWRCRMQSLYVSGETCLTFDDRDSHDELTDDQAAQDVEAIAGHLNNLHNVSFNREIGLAGRERLRRVAWNADKDGPSLRAWLGRHFQ